MDTPRLSDFVEQDHDRIVSTLFDWLRIPSISASELHRDEVRRSASFLVEHCRDRGLEHLTILETPGHPAVYADWLHAGDHAPTVLIYGHHDVQPVDPLEEWTTPPFDPIIVDDECRARGAIDDKGQVLYQLEALGALLAADGSLPVNVKVLVEGEEEIGSPHFEDLLHEHSELLACDVIVVSDTGMLAPDIASTDVAMRGLVACTVRLTTGTHDLHSGLFGGTVPNPLHHLSRLVAALHTPDGKVAVDGFYDDIRELSGREAWSLDTQPFDEAAFRDIAGVERLEGETGRSPLERIGSRPTAEVVGISGGYTGDGIKTIVPAHATAKLTFRLVADQDPADVMTKVGRWLATQVADGVRLSVTWHGGVAPAHTDTEHWAFGALCRTIERVWGAEPLLTRVGGSGPEETLGRVLDAPVLFLGVGLPDDRIHAPDERMVMSQFWRGLLAAGELYRELADAAPSPDHRAGTEDA